MFTRTRNRSLLAVCLVLAVLALSVLGGATPALADEAPAQETPTITETPATPEASSTPDKTEAPSEEAPAKVETPAPAPTEEASAPKTEEKAEAPAPKSNHAPSAAKSKDAAKTVSQGDGVVSLAYTNGKYTLTLKEAKAWEVKLITPSPQEIVCGQNYGKPCISTVYTFASQADCVMVQVDWQSGSGYNSSDPTACKPTTPPEDDTDSKKVEFCHATGSESNPFVLLNTSVNAFYQAGHDTHQGGRDIVPPFSYKKKGQTISFPGLNWDATGQAIFKNGCEVPKPPTTCVKDSPTYVWGSNVVSVQGAKPGTWLSMWDAKDKANQTLIAKVKVGDDCKATTAVPPAECKPHQYQWDLSSMEPPATIKDTTGDGIADVPGWIAGELFTVPGDDSLCTPPPTPKTPTVTASADACVKDGDKTGQVNVAVINTDDDTNETVTYDVTLNGATKQVKVEDGKSGSVQFTGLAVGDYPISVKGDDGTTASTTVKVTKCDTPPPTKIDLPKPAFEDPCGPNNAKWKDQVDTDVLTWKVDEQGNLIATIIKDKVVFNDRTTTHNFGKAPESGELCPPVVVINPTASVEVLCEGTGTATLDNSKSTTSVGFEVVKNGEVTLYSVAAGKVEIKAFSGAKSGSQVIVQDAEANKLASATVPDKCSTPPVVVTPECPDGVKWSDKDKDGVVDKGECQSIGTPIHLDLPPNEPTTPVVQTPSVPPHAGVGGSTASTDLSPLVPVGGLLVLLMAVASTRGRRPEGAHRR